MFFQQEELAKTEEKKTDEILDGENKQTEKPAKDAPLKAHTQYIEETIALREYNLLNNLLYLYFTYKFDT